MLKLIIEKEIRENIKTAKFAVTFFICSALILLAFYTGAKNYQSAKAKYEAAKMENLKKYEGLTNWLQVNQFRVYLPPSPAEALINGVSNDIGRTIEMKGKGELKAEDSIYGEEPVFAVFRYLDLQFVFSIVLTLFAVMFAYDSVNGEKERGTLRLTFSYPVPRDVYISGKIIGAFLSLVLPLLIPVFTGLLLLPLFGVGIDADLAGRLAVAVASGFLLTGAFLTLSVMLSSMTHKSSNSFLLLLVIWIFAVSILPRVSVIAAGSLINVTPVDEINSQKTRLQTQLWSEERKAFSQFKPPAGADMQTIMASLNQFMKKKADERTKKVDELSRLLNEERNNKAGAMENLAFTFARLSPVTVFTFAAQKGAGTSLEQEEQFEKAASAYRDLYMKFLDSKTGGLGGAQIMVFSKTSDNNEKPKTINPREIPEFTYQPRPLSAAFAGLLPELGLLALFNIIFFAGAFFSFRKYDVR
jgi:ABC-2 type transport system permease protein